MENKDVLIADSMKYQRMWYAMDIWLQQFFKRIDLSKLLIYFIDHVDASALPLLAEEFDVLGIKGWDFADTEEKQRELIKRAVELHRYKGTPWAVEQVMLQIGYDAAVLIEGISSTGDPLLDDATIDWARFAFWIDADVAADAAMIAQAEALIAIYKNQRSVFMGVLYYLLYDGVWTYDGTRHYIGPV